MSLRTCINVLVQLVTTFWVVDSLDASCRPEVSEVFTLECRNPNKEIHVLF